MLNNIDYLNLAAKEITAFQSKKELEHLRAASMSLMNVDLRTEIKPESRKLIRIKCLKLWMELLQIIDQNIDPKFNPNEQPVLIISPPEENGIQLRPGADPKLIKDPKLRQEYELAIEKNRKYADYFRFQKQINDINLEAQHSAEDFIRGFYSSTIIDQSELKSAIDKQITNENRKMELYKLLAPMSH